jgi:hypothetical protein
LERGASIVARVLADASIDIEKVLAPVETLPAAAPISVNFSSKIFDATTPFKFYIEKSKGLKPIVFDVSTTAQLGDALRGLQSLQLIAVDTVPVPTATTALSSTATTVTFDG